MRIFGEKELKHTSDRLYIYAGGIGMVLLFFAVAAYIFVSLGMLSFGVVALPCVFFGKLGFLTIISDLDPGALMLVSGGMLLLGAGMCFGMIPLCSAAYGVYVRFLRSSAIRRERIFNEKDQSS